MQGRKWLTLALTFLIGSSWSAQARTRHYRKRGAIVVALQPFLRARSAVHAAINPVVFNAPRILTAPIRVAYQTARPANEKIYNVGEVDHGLTNEAPDETAYFTSRVRHPRPPRAEVIGPAEDDQDEPRRAEAHDDFNSRGGAQPMISGDTAVLRNGIARAPANAPVRVKNAIWAANTLRGKPYIWGGGHGSFTDRGYDCSGTVSFALHHAGLLTTPLPSNEFMRYGEGGRGRWITIYSRRGHTFAMIAGLRLDTTDFAIGGNVGPRWHLDARDTMGYVARHPAGL